MPTVTMLIGLPGCGKSTWRCANEDWLQLVVSSDDHIELMAQVQGKTYNEIFRDYIDDAERICNTVFDYALETKADVVIDRTNLSVKARRKWLARVPSEYRVKAVVFAPPVVQSDIWEWERRLDSRVGKTIPSSVLATMRESFQLPQAGEAFDEIQHVNTFRDPL